MLAALRRASAVRPKANDEADSAQPAGLTQNANYPTSIPATTTSTGSSQPAGSRLNGAANYQDAHNTLEEVDEDALELPDAQDSLQPGDYARSQGSGLSPPRLFRRLPKRRRIDDLLNKETLVNVVGDTHSITSSSNETNVDSANHYSTPATSSSDEGDMALALQERTLIQSVEGGDLKELNGNTVEINMTEFTKACQDGRGTEFLKERGIDLDKRDRQSTVTPTQSSQQIEEEPIEALHKEEDVLGQRMELLSLADVDMLVRHVAQGNSFFGGAGVTAVAAGLGLYDQSEDAASMLPGETEKAAEDFAKLALWATLPGAIEAWISAPDRNTIERSDSSARQRLSPLSSLYDKVVESESRQLVSDGYVDEGEDEDDLEEAERVHDAFDANDKERWMSGGGKAQYGRSRKMRSSPASSATVSGFNTKKRKVPSAGMSAIDDSPLTSPKFYKREENSFHSGEDAGRANVPDRSSLVSLADEILGVPAVPDQQLQMTRQRPVQKPPVSSQAFKRDADMLARLPDADTLAAYVAGPAISRMYRKTKRVPLSSYRTVKYAEKRNKTARWPLLAPPLPYDFIDPRDALPPPMSTLPSVPQPVLPMTAKRAAKAKKAKLKMPPQPVQPTLTAPTLPPLFDTAIISFDRGQQPREWLSSKFSCECASERFQADLRAFQTQKLHLLMLLKAKRREELLRRKLELEEEKERLTRALAADLKGKGRLPPRKPQAALPPVPASGSAQTAPPLAPLPPPPPPPTTDLPPTPTHNGKPPPKKGKKKRSAYANANNSHHRQNYIPSRLPASSGGKPGHNPDGLDASAGGSLDIPLPHGNDSEVLNFAPDDWMCTFCEYELWYGSKPQLANCVKKRKKLLKVRQKAVDRAKGTVEGTNKKKPTPASAAPASTAQSPATSGGTSTTSKSAATLPGTMEQQAKAENAKPTRAPPSSPTVNNLPVKGATLPASAARMAKVDDKPDGKAALHAAAGVSYERLLNLHCVSNGLGTPIYYLTDMKVPASTPGGKEVYYQACSLKIGKEIYKLGILSNEVQSLGKHLAKIPHNSADAKEDLTQRVVGYLLSGEKLTWNMSHAVSQQGLVIYRPGEKDFICSLKEASQVYKNASALLEEYVRLDGGPLPAWYIQTTESDPDSGAPETFLVSVALGTRVFDVEESTDEAAAREKAAVKALEWLQRDKNEKFTEMIRQSKAGRAKGIDEEIAELEAVEEEDLNDVD